MREEAKRYEVSIDKISFVYDVPAYRSASPGCKRFWGYFNRLVSNCEREYGSNFIFDHNVKYYDMHLSWGRGIDDSGSKMRIEFNPNKVKWEPLFHLLWFIGEIAVKSSKVTRIDTAIDYLTDLDANMFYDKYKRKCNYHYGKGNGLETVYLGSNKSDVKFRIYNKAVEQKENSNVDVYHSWWRVEAQDQRGYDFFGWVENPFKTLRYYRKYDTSSLKGLEYFFWHFVEERGLQAGLSYVLEKSKRKRLVSNLVESREIVQPHEVFENDFRGIWEGFKQKILINLRPK